MHFLITAGPTREYLDTVRFISNASSGLTGYMVAEAAARRGHKVTLVSGPVALPRPCGVKLIAVVSADEMHRACRHAFADADAVVATAAVCDYRPVRRATRKIKKTAKPVTVMFTRTPDILADLGQRKRPGQALVGFALEDRRPIAGARHKLVEKNLDAIILNAPSALGAARNRVRVFFAGAWHDWPEMTKRVLGRRIVRLVESLVENR